MQTATETDRVQCVIPSVFPTLNLLFLGGTGVVGRTFPLRTGVTLLGRGVLETEGIPLGTDRMASSRHAQLELCEVPGGPEGPSFLIRLIDIDSKNGTFLNGQPTTVANLQDDDVIRIGNSLLLLRLEPARVLDAPEGDMLGRAPAMRAVRYRLQQAACSTAPVLLQGESGTGKELAAQRLHRDSGRCGELIAVNCAALPEHLAESLLFGHERGAFSGAETRQEGFFAAAQRGTIFLDEAGELPPGVQAKLLRALQEGQITPVGRTRPVPCDVRVVAATNRDLARAVQQGGFREDLYSRLRGEMITLPPLRARREDILPLLAHAFRQRTCADLRLTPRAAESLVLYHWPHNVREICQMAHALGPRLGGAELDLAMFVERLQAACVKETRAAGPAAKRQKTAPPAERAQQARLGRLSPDVLERLGREHQWNISKLAEIVGRSRRQVRRWLAEYGLQPAPGPQPPRAST